MHINCNALINFMIILKVLSILREITKILLQLFHDVFSAFSIAEKFGKYWAKLFVCRRGK